MMVIGSIARSAKRQYLSYSEGDFNVFFDPQGQRFAPMGVKFGTPYQIVPSSLQR